MSKKPQPFASIQTPQVDEWKVKHKKVEIITIPGVGDDDEEANFYVRMPTVSEQNLITEVMTDKKGSVVKGMETLKATVLLGGDLHRIEGESDASVFSALMTEIGEMVSQKKAIRRTA